MNPKALIAGALLDCPVHKISAADSNKFVLLFGGDDAPFVSVIEIFDEKGKTPPNFHKEAYEYFYVLHGEGVANIGEEVVALQPGSYLLVPPGVNHEVHNTGEGRLYVLTTMVPDEQFTQMILSGPKAELDEEDRKKLQVGSDFLV